MAYVIECHEMIGETENNGWVDADGGFDGLNYAEIFDFYEDAEERIESLPPLPLYRGLRMPYSITRQRSAIEPNGFYTIRFLFHCLGRTGYTALSHQTQINGGLWEWIPKIREKRTNGGNANAANVIMWI